MYRVDLEPFTGESWILETFTFYAAYRIAIAEARAARNTLSGEAHVYIEKIVPDVLTGRDKRWICTVSNVHGWILVGYNGKLAIIKEADDE